MNTNYYKSKRFPGDSGNEQFWTPIGLLRGASMAEMALFFVLVMKVCIDFTTVKLQNLEQG